MGGVKGMIVHGRKIALREEFLPVERVYWEIVEKNGGSKIVPLPISTRKESSRGLGSENISCL